MDREKWPMIHHVSALAGEAAAGLIDLLYPPLCLHCDARTAPGVLLCPACRARLEPVDAAATARLLERLETNWIDDAVSVWYFDKGSPLQDVQHALKYGNRPVCGSWMGAHLARALRQVPGSEPDFIVPIPLHHARMLERGYNQSRAIAAAVADVLELPLRTDVLTRTRATLSQTNFTRAERRANLENVFAVPDQADLEDRHILVIDDVMTTGATFESAARALKTSGAARVTAASVGLARN